MIVVSTSIIIISIFIVSVQSSESILINNNQRLQKFHHLRRSIDTKRRTTTSADTTTTTPHHHHIDTILYQQIPSHDIVTIQTESIPPVDTVTTTTTTTAMFSFPKIPFHTIYDQIQKYTSLLQQQQQRRQQSTPYITIHIHCIVLVHGWMGNSKELLYLQARLEREATSILSSSSASSLSSDDEGVTSSSTKSTSTSIRIPIVIPYSSIINEGKTHDGIVSGGQRLAYEVNLWIQQIREQIVIEQQRQSDSIYKDSRSIQYKISLSMIGNSLGGLYARYALKDIQFHYPTNITYGSNNNDSTIDPILYKAVFATTCTPHLGVGNEHLYIPNLVPSSIQTIIAKIIGPTGIDLFRIPVSKHNINSTNDNDVDIIQQMTFQNEFIVPLQNFHQRIAFSNTFHTDFQVPCSTAAFLLSPSSSTPTSPLKLHQHFIDPNYYQISKKWNVNAINDNNNNIIDNNNMKQQRPKSSIALIVESTKQPSIYKSNNITEHDIGDNRNQIHSIATSNELAYQLNSFGWVKIFCDVRPYLPFISTNVIHKFVETIYNFITYLYSFVITLNNNTNNQNNSSFDAKIMSNSNITNKESYSSKDIWDQYVVAKNTTCINKHRWYVPFGHTVVIANSKNAFFRYFNQPGQPTMDHFAKIIVHEIIHTQD